MIVDENTQLPLGGMGGCIHSWERGLDPWHADAFKGTPVEKQMTDCRPTGERKGGWFGLDGCGNVIHWIPDGTELED